MSENVREVSAESWETEVLRAEQPVLVDFWAPWCGPCRALAPVIDELAVEFAGRARVAKLNVDENESVAARYEVQAIPSLLVFRGGEVVDRRLGAAPKSELVRLLDAQVPKSGEPASTR